MARKACKSCGAHRHVHRRLYECSLCGDKFCDAHCCNATYVEHFRDIGFAELDSLFKEGNVFRKYPLKSHFTYVCNNCFFEHGPDDHGLAENIFGRKCSIDGCDNSLGVKSRD